MHAQCHAVIALAVVGGQRLTVLGQLAEHPFSPLDVGLLVVGAHGIDPERIERVAFGRHQIPAAILFFSAEKTAGLEARTLGPATELVQAPASP